MAEKNSMTRNCKRWYRESLSQSQVFDKVKERHLSGRHPWAQSEALDSWHHHDICGLQWMSVVASAHQQLIANISPCVLLKTTTPISGKTCFGCYTFLRCCHLFDIADFLVGHELKLPPPRVYWLYFWKRLSTEQKPDWSQTALQRETKCELTRSRWSHEASEELQWITNDTATIGSSQRIASWVVGLLEDR